MRILVISDTHRKNLLMKEAVERAGKVDLVLHLGDIEGADEYLTSLCDCPAIIVRGNNDFFSYQERDRVLELEGYRILMTHGHNYGVSLTPTRLAEEALSRNCTIALHGHTHVPGLANVLGVKIFNPGSLGYPRQSSHTNTYGLIEIDRYGEIHFTICEL
ncbi:MAG: metallophosphoesterase [Lachnospiraceae bacterium]|nr:metallophosphoesterase [Lachnospiraceae bacterium]